MSTAEPGLLLRLAGPLQSWGERSHFNERDTTAFPTRSGVIGLLAAALGRGRHEPVQDLARLSLTIRADRPGIPLRDLHTVGGGLPPQATVTTAEGKKRSGETGTLLTHRTYLADAAFTLALTPTADDADSRELLHQVAHALQRPRWPLFLGRRSCPPEGPVLLGETDDALHHLVHLPLTGTPPRTPNPEVQFYSDRPLDRLPGPAAPEAAEIVGEVTDEPLSFHPRRRTYRARPHYRRALPLPATQYAGLGTTYLNALTAYLKDHVPHPEGSRP
ncbi:type I-E CRISPR-associated protein Cas5/CasD [Streptomyces sp. NPDC003077]|uniref:type I-E CRISPR-associated protein Cas5/CasD n=1 Tax=Streptomyces sp. NPDC003077 TaxID=3154443 RepID=UPI0033B5DD31